MNNFEIISGYTKNTPYENEVKYLIESLKKFNFSTDHIVAYETKGTWEKNCQFKAVIIKNKLKELNKPIVWIDADAVLCNDPVLFNKIDKDIAFCRHGTLLSGTLFFKPTQECFDIIDEWIIENEKNPEGLDQVMLEKVLKRRKTKFFILPFTYCKVDFFPKVGEMVIEQNQASRRFKKIINNPKAFTKTDHDDGKYNINAEIKKFANNFKNKPKLDNKIKIILSECLKSYNIKSMSDVGCGDQSWIKKIDMSEIEYTGYDIVPRGKEVVFFDATSEILPKTDLIFCRGITGHITNKRIKSLLENFKKSESKYLMIDFYKKIENFEIPSIKKFSFRRVDLMQDPFNLPIPDQEFLDNKFSLRYIGIWDLSKI